MLFTYLSKAIIYVTYKKKKKIQDSGEEKSLYTLLRH